MKFLIDAQLPPLLAQILNEAGHDAIHTISLSNGNETPDDEIIKICQHQSRILVTKDTDFYHLKTLKNIPQYLLLVKVGNCKVKFLLDLFRRNLKQIPVAFEKGSLVEINPSEILVVY